MKILYTINNYGYRTIEADRMILGIDIGGANTKIASDDGKLAELHYMPLWKNGRLEEKLLEISSRLKPDKVGVVITGELADCFPDKDTGLSYIIDAVNRAFSNAYFLDSEGVFSRERRRSIAAANWTASALIVAKEYKNCIFVDIGSTTADIIPVKGGQPIAGKTDFERLKRGELVYTGTLRTNIATILKSVDIGKERCRTSSEIFALTADAYMLLGYILPEYYTCDTADGRGKNIQDVKRRLARLVCADLTEIRDSDIMEIARQVMEAQVDEIRDAICKISVRYGLDMIVACGLGEFLVERAASDSGIDLVLISEKYGKDISRVFPAYSAAILLKEAINK